MGKPVTLLESLCGHVLSFDARAFDVRDNEDYQQGFALIDGAQSRVLNLKKSSHEAKELRENLRAAAKKPIRAILGAKVYLLIVSVREDLGEEVFDVSIDPAPTVSALSPPKFTAKQGQYLAYIYNYTKIHGRAPSEPDLERYFRVSAPSIHEMVKTLHRNGLIERTPGTARSIRLLVNPDHLPRLGR